MLIHIQKGGLGLLLKDWQRNKLYIHMYILSYVYDSSHILWFPTLYNIFVI